MTRQNNTKYIEIYKNEKKKEDWRKKLNKKKIDGEWMWGCFNQQITQKIVELKHPRKDIIQES